MKSALIMLLLLATVGTAIAAPPSERELVPLAGPRLPESLVRNNVDVSLVPPAPYKLATLKVDYHVTDWPNVFFRPVSGTWDWAGYTGIAIDITNPEAESQSVSVRVDNAGADGVSSCNQAGTSVPAHGKSTFRMRFSRGGDNTLWGMRGLPVTGPTGGGVVLDLHKIVAFQVFLSRPTRAHTLLLSNIRLYGPSAEADDKVRFPFVDRFGQYRNASWPGKLANEPALKARAVKEAALLKNNTSPEFDTLGGWAAGPHTKATGWFRTEKRDGKWWLVTPQGRLFFSTGIDCIGPGEQTFVEGRTSWFEWLPAAADPLAAFYANVSGAHSLAEPVGGKGKAFSFYAANLYRKHGPNWRTSWMDTSAARMRNWGFNTVGNWSDWTFMEREKLPFVASDSIGSGARKVEGGGGYWGKMVDAFDPDFPKYAQESLGNATGRFHNNPLCIGYFSDNELSWEAVERGSLASAPDQPCRIEQVKMLKQKYGEGVEALNRAWGTTATNWDTLRVPAAPNAACRQDLDAYVHHFARRYFEVCRDAIKHHAPNQLYLGCRFATAPEPAVRACAEVADVVSFNIYQGGVNKADFTGTRDLNKPIIIGEFHFGALDRGMFHEGLGPRQNQKERAEAYAAYVRSVADCPAFVGCHWFQYVDEPITGRWYDGENYNIGMVDVTDTPYPELTSAAIRANHEVYRVHAAATP